MDLQQLHTQLYLQAVQIIIQIIDNLATLQRLRFQKFVDHSWGSLYGVRKLSNHLKIGAKYH